MTLPWFSCSFSSTEQEPPRSSVYSVALLERVSSFHGRISNGEQVQVDVGDGSGRTPQVYVQIWAQGMRAWMQGARPGDVLPFASELGPPAYAIVDPSGREISDRWQQSLVMKRLAEQAWQEAVSG